MQIIFYSALIALIFTLFLTGLKRSIASLATFLIIFNLCMSISIINDYTNKAVWNEGICLACHIAYEKQGEFYICPNCGIKIH